MPNDKQALNFFKTYMVLGPDYQHGRQPKRIFPKSIVHNIMQYAQYEEWIDTAKDLAALLERNELNFITQSESWAQDPSLSDAKKWLTNPNKPRITESYDFIDKSIMPLIKFIAETPFVDRSGIAILMWAARYNHAEALRALLAAPGIDVNAKTKRGWIALHTAAAYGHTETLKVLLRVPNINVNAVDEHCWTTLMFAARSGRTEALKALLTMPGIDVNAVNDAGSTALMMAAYSGHTEAKQLIDNHLKQETAFSRKIFF